MSGTIPTTIATLSSLGKYVWGVTCQNCTRAHPSVLVVEYFAVAFNSFSGSIPSQLGSLGRLGESVDCPSIHCQFGTSSAEKKLTHCLSCAIEFINMRSSQVSGRIPTELGQLENLQTLLLEGNWLSGTIPQQLGNLVNSRKYLTTVANNEAPHKNTHSHSSSCLEQMSFRKNYLTGRVSNDICELRDVALRELKVDSWIECDCCTD